MKSQAYTEDRIPFVADISLYCGNWIKWWTSCQPAWRRNSGWPLPRNDTGTTDWTKICVCGQNGLFLIVMSTTWWAASIVSEEDWVEFDEAVDDIHWVIGQIQDSLSALPVPTPPETSEDLPSSSNIGWMAHANGKHRPKPTARLLEGGGF